MAKIIIKADDFRATSNDRWKRFAECCIENDIPATVGFIAGNVGEGSIVDKELLDIFKQPRFEIWNHSYRHRIDDKGNTDFYGPDMVEQLSSIEKTQTLAKELFGAAPKGFGPPFNKYDASTLKALKAIGCFEYAFDIGYIEGIKTMPKALYVECEGPANGRKFGLEAALKKSQNFMLKRIDFVLQIHPGNHWEEECIGKFVKFIQYMKASGYEFSRMSE